MKKYLIMVPLLIISMVSCKKELQQDHQHLTKKDGTFQDEGLIPGYEATCAYLFANAPIPVLDRLDQEQNLYTDPAEYQLDKWSILLAQGIHDFAAGFCQSGERWEFFTTLENVGNKRRMLQDLFNSYSTLYPHLDNYFTVNGSLSINQPQTANSARK